MWNLYTDASNSYICLYIDNDIIIKGLENEHENWWMSINELENLTTEVLDSTYTSNRDSITNWTHNEPDVKLLISNISIPITREKYPELFI